MKKLILSALAIAAMVSCSKSDKADSNSTEIKLSAAVSNVNLAKSPIDAWANTPVSFAKGVASGTYTETWNATVAAGGTVALTPQQAYTPTDTYWLKGYAPQGTFATGAVTFTGMDGTQDILLSQQLSGSKASPFVATTPFVFNHELTQLNFKVAGSAGFIADATNAAVTSIKVNGTKLPVSMDLATGVITYAPTASAINAFTGNAVLDIEPTAVSFGAVMVEPGRAITLDVVADGATYQAVPVIIKNGTTALKGTAYTITISIKNTDEVILTSEITPWVQGTGSADIEK